MAGLEVLCALHCRSVQRLLPEVCEKERSLSADASTVDAAGSVDTRVSEEQLVVLTDGKLELHFRRGLDASEWRMQAQPLRGDSAPGDKRQHNYRALIADGRLP